MRRLNYRFEFQMRFICLCGIVFADIPLWDFPNSDTAWDILFPNNDWMTESAFLAGGVPTGEPEVIATVDNVITAPPNDEDVTGNNITWLLPSQREVLEDYRDSPLLFEQAIDGLTQKFIQNRIPPLSKLECKKVWEILGLGVGPSRVRKSHLEIIEQMILTEGIPQFLIADNNAKYREACRLFSEASLSPISLRVFLELSGSIQRKHGQAVQAGNTNRLKEITREVVLLAGSRDNMTVKKLYQIACERFKLESLRPVSLSTFNLWRRRINYLLEGSDSIPVRQRGRPKSLDDVAIVPDFIMHDTLPANRGPLMLKTISEVGNPIPGFGHVILQKNSENKILHANNRDVNEVSEVGRDILPTNSGKNTLPTNIGGENHFSEFDLLPYNMFSTNSGDRNHIPEVHTFPQNMLQANGRNTLQSISGGQKQVSEVDLFPYNMLQTNSGYANVISEVENYADNMVQTLEHNMLQTNIEVVNQVSEVDLFPNNMLSTNGGDGNQISEVGFFPHSMHPLNSGPNMLQTNGGGSNHIPEFDLFPYSILQTNSHNMIETISGAENHVSEADLFNKLLSTIGGDENHISEFDLFTHNMLQTKGHNMIEKISGRQISRSEIIPELFPDNSVPANIEPFPIPTLEEPRILTEHLISISGPSPDAMQQDWMNDIHFLSENLSANSLAHTSQQEEQNGSDCWSARHEGACTSAWAEFPIVTLKTDYTKHDDILKEVLKSFDSELSLMDIHAAVSGLFAEAKLPRMSIRIFTQHWLRLRGELNLAYDTSDDMGRKRRYYTSGHKTIVREVASAHPSATAEKLFRLASEQFAQAKLPPMKLRSFQAWIHEMRKTNNISTFNSDAETGRDIDEILSDLIISNPRLTLRDAFQALRNKPKLAGHQLPSRVWIKTWLQQYRRRGLRV